MGDPPRRTFTTANLRHERGIMNYEWKSLKRSVGERGWGEFSLILWEKIFILGKQLEGMEITIIDISFDFDEFDNDSKLLWSVVPFANGINVASFLSNLILYDLDKDTMSEKAKVDFIKITLGNSKLNLDIAGIEKGFLEYLKLKKMKHKNKHALIYVKRVEKAIETLYNMALKYVCEIEKVYKVDELHSLFSFPHEGVIGLYFLEVHEPTEFCAFEVECITTTILNGHEFPIFTDKAEKYFDADSAPMVSLTNEPERNAAEEHSGDALFTDKPEAEGSLSAKAGDDPPNPPRRTDLRQTDILSATTDESATQNAGDGGDGEKKIKIIREKFLEFVSPRTLTKNKLEIVRGELTKVYEPLGNLLKSFKSDLLLKKDIMGIAEAGLFYEDSIKPEVKKLQEAIDDNIYFQQIENSSEEKERFALYLCVCSIEDLLYLFEKTTFVPRATIDFSREEIQGKTDLKRPTLFLYLKTETDGNNDF